MQIKEAKIFNFGKLQNKNLHFAPGINVVYGKNESGKSTLHAFLMGMLFGMEKNRGRASEADAYTRYEPWHAPSYYSGALRFEVDKKPFYLERNFYVKEKSELLRNEEDGEELSVVYGDLNMLLGGIGKETFGNTYDIPQTGAVTGQAMTALLTEYLQDAAGGGAGIHVHKAIAELQKRRKELNADLRKTQEEREVALQRKQLELTLLERDCEELRRNMEPYLQFQTEENEAVEVTANQSKCYKTDTGWIVADILVTVILFLLKIVKYIPLKIFVIGILILILTNLFVILIKKRRIKKPCKILNREKPKADRAKSYAQVTQGAEEIEAQNTGKLQAAWEMYQKLQDTLQEKEIRLFQLKEEIEQAKQSTMGEKELKENIVALELAAMELERLSKEYYEEIEDELNAEISRYVSLLTNGAYDSVRLGEKGDIRIVTEGRNVTPQSLSSGTLEQIYLALRLAVGAIVTKEEAMPIFLDDAFAMYDDERLIQTLRVLAGFDRQILIFSCQKREYNILEEIGIPFHKIEL